MAGKISDLIKWLGKSVISMTWHNSLFPPIFSGVTFLSTMRSHAPSRLCKLTRRVGAYFASSAAAFSAITFNDVTPDAISGHSLPRLGSVLLPSIFTNGEVDQHVPLQHHCTLVHIFKGTVRWWRRCCLKYSARFYRCAGNPKIHLVAAAKEIKCFTHLRLQLWLRHGGEVHKITFCLDGKWKCCGKALFVQSKKNTQQPNATTTGWISLFLLVKNSAVLIYRPTWKIKRQFRVAKTRKHMTMISNQFHLLFAFYFLHRNLLFQFQLDVSILLLLPSKSKKRNFGWTENGHPISDTLWGTIFSSPSKQEVI